MIYVLVIILAGNTTGNPDRLRFFGTAEICERMKPVERFHFEVQGRPVQSVTCSPLPIHRDGARHRG